MQSFYEIGSVASLNQALADHKCRFEVDRDVAKLCGLPAPTILVELDVVPEKITALLNAAFECIHGYVSGPDDTFKEQGLAKSERAQTLYFRYGMDEYALTSEREGGTLVITLGLLENR